MNSSFSVSDVGAFSPVDFGTPSVVRLGTAAAEASTASSHTRRRSSTAVANRTAEEQFKVTIQPTVSAFGLER